MTLEQFLLHVEQNTGPDKDWSNQLLALWYAERKNWDLAHQVCQKGTTSVDAWIHANLHREEGDLSNARYWYSRAGKPEHKGSITEERHEIITTLLS